jgi:hypothetical protein
VYAYTISSSSDRTLLTSDCSNTKTTRSIVTFCIRNSELSDLARQGHVAVVIYGFGETGGSRASVKSCKVTRMKKHALSFSRFLFWNSTVATDLRVVSF